MHQPDCRCRTAAAATEQIRVRQDVAQTILEVRNVSKHFVVKKNLFSKKRVIEAVRNASFKVLEGESLGLVGESGSGKSTTANLILRLLDCSEGRISFRGTVISDLTEGDMRRLRKDIQIIFQFTSSILDPKMTVEELLTEPLRIHGVVEEHELDPEVNRLLSLVGLSPDERPKYPDQLSGGQIQRIIIARAIAPRPKLIVCDEPVSALDVSIQGQILNLLTRLKSELELTYLFISHDLKVVRHICDRIAVMYKGEIVEIGTKDDILSNPEHDYTKHLLSSEL